MAYNDRVTLITYGLGPPNKLGERKRIPFKESVPCDIAQLTTNAQMGIFGKVNFNALEIHLQGRYDDIEQVEYKGAVREIKGIQHHKNTTVVIIS